MMSLADVTVCRLLCGEYLASANGETSHVLWYPCLYPRALWQLRGCLCMISVYWCIAYFGIQLCALHWEVLNSGKIWLARLPHPFASPNHPAFRWDNQAFQATEAVWLQLCLFFICGTYCEVFTLERLVFVQGVLCTLEGSTVQCYVRTLRRSTSTSFSCLLPTRSILQHDPAVHPMQDFVFTHWFSLNVSTWGRSSFHAPANEINFSHHPLDLVRREARLGDWIAPSLLTI